MEEELRNRMGKSDWFLVSLLSGILVSGFLSYQAGKGIGRHQEGNRCHQVVTEIHDEHKERIRQIRTETCEEAATACQPEYHPLIEELDANSCICFSPMYNNKLRVTYTQNRAEGE